MSNFLSAIGCALLLCISMPTLAADIPPVEYETFTLDNGMTFVVHEDHSTPIVAVNVWYDVGSANEPEGRSGFAHLFEHMLFEETENLAAGDFKQYIRNAGGSYNGTTNEDRTAYFETLPANRLNLAFWLEAERMARLRVTEENFDREREVVKEERRLRIENQPYTEGFLTLTTMSADWEPYQHTVIGSMEDLNAATVDDVNEFHRQFYGPNHATMVVAGDTNVSEVRELAEKYFGSVPAGPEHPALPEQPVVPRECCERREIIEDELANLPAFVSAFNVPPHDADDARALTLLSNIFSQGESSRLHQRLVREEQAAVNIFAGLSSRLGPGLFYFGALPNQGVEPERIENLLAEEIEKLKTEGVTERELRKAKNQLIANEVRSRQTAFSKASQLQHFRLFHGDIDEINTDIDAYEDVTLADVQRVAQVYLTQGNRTAVTIVPTG